MRTLVQIFEVRTHLVVQILFDLFQHDMRLWKAYSTTIQVGLLSFTAAFVYELVLTLISCIHSVSFSIHRVP